jgi:hypothetical protein
VVVGEAGASALRTYEQLSVRRKAHARSKLGVAGTFLAAVVDEPQSMNAWQQGGQGEARAGDRLTKHLEGRGVRLLHDRRIPGHGQANIDHIAIGMGGVTVIDTKALHGQVKVDRVGGLFSPRRSRLLVGGRERTNVVSGVERQIGYVRAALADVGHEDIEIRGALCFIEVEGLPRFRQLQVRDVIIDGPKPVAKLARRPGPVNANTIDRVWRLLALQFPPA